MPAPIVVGIGVGLLKIGAKYGPKAYKAGRSWWKARKARKAAEKAKKAAEKAKQCKGNCNRVIKYNDRQLQKKYKHAQDFGVEGPYNPANASKFKNAIENHVSSSSTRVIEGTYRGNPATHYLNPQSGLNGIKDSGGNFVSGWRLGSGQLRSVQQSGALN